MHRERIWALALCLLGAGCYDSSSAARPDAGADVAAMVDRADDAASADADDATVVDAMDAISAVDAGDAATDAADGSLPRDTSDVVEDLVTDLGPPPCPSGRSRCGESCVDTSASIAHCGMCGMACPARANATASCAMGACGFTCNAGFADCDGDPSNGCEADLGTPRNCGRCEARCMEPSPLCQEAGGQRTCVSGCSGAASTRCAMSCVDAQTDVQHCGACDRACAVPMNGRATCAAGSCGFACNTGFADCDGNASNGCEADLSAQTSCGACGTTCAPSSRCMRGVCAPCSALAPMAGGRAEVADAASLRLAGGSFTIEAWLFATGYPNRCQNAIATKRGSASADGWFFSVTGNDCGVPAGRLYYQVSGGNDPSVVASTAAPTGRWFHAAATYDAGTRVLTLWQDGAAVGSATLPPPSATTAAPMYIGNDSDGQAYAWSGYIDELRISSGVRYGGTFTAPAQLDRDAPVIALWRFQESTGVAVDASPNGYVARLVMADRVVSTAVCRP